LGSVTYDFLTNNLVTTSSATSFVTISNANNVTFPTVLQGGFTIVNYTLNLDTSMSVSTNITIASGGNLSHSINYSSSVYNLNLTITGNLTVNSGGLLMWTV